MTETDREMHKKLAKDGLRDRQTGRARDRDGETRKDKDGQRDIVRPQFISCIGIHIVPHPDIIGHYWVEPSFGSNNLPKVG